MSRSVSLGSIRQLIVKVDLVTELPAVVVSDSERGPRDLLSSRRMYRACATSAIGALLVPAKTIALIA